MTTVEDPYRSMKVLAASLRRLAATVAIPGCVYISLPCALAETTSTSVPSTSAPSTSVQATESVSNSVSGSLSEDEKKRVFRDFIHSAFRGDFKNALASMDEQMQSALPEEKLKVVIAKFQEAFGDLKSIDSVSIKPSKTPGEDNLVAECTFSNKKADASTGINERGKLTTLFFKPHLEYPIAAYVHRDNFKEQEVEIPSGKFKIKATLSLPKSATPPPCVVLVHGSGPCDRDETVGGIKVFRDLAWGLASQGIAVLRYEKRTAQFPREPIETVDAETVDDAIAAIEFLKTESGVDKNRIVILGHSLGALMAPQIAGKEKSVAGLVICAGPTRNLEQSILDQISYLRSIEPNSVSLERLEKTRADVAAVKALEKDSMVTNEKPLLGHAPSWWVDIRDYDPIKTAKSLTIPMLILQGDHDYQVTMEDLRGWQSGLVDYKNVTFKVYPGLAHTFTQSADKPNPADYDKPANVDASVVADVSQWIKSLPPLPQVSNASMPAADEPSSQPVQIPFTIQDNRLFVKLLLNEKGPFTFIFDTGGCFSITPTAAIQLNLKLTSADKATGAGPKAVPMSHTLVKTTSLGALNFSNQDFLVIDYSPIKKAFKFPDLDGILGYEILQNYSVKIDYERQRLLLGKNTEALELANHARIPCTFEFCKPVIESTIDGNKARILVDTGDRSALTLFTAFVSSHPSLQNSFKNSSVVSTGYGIGGPILGKLGRVDRLQMTSDLFLNKVMTRTPTSKTGFNALKNLDGSIGNEVLKHFDVVFDYRNACIYLGKSSQYESPTSFHPFREAQSAAD